MVDSDVSTEMIVETCVFGAVMVVLLCGFGVSFVYEYRNRVFQYYKLMHAQALDQHHNALHAHAHGSGGHAHSPHTADVRHLAVRHSLPDLPRHASAPTPHAVHASTHANSPHAHAHALDVPVPTIPPPAYSALPPSPHDFPWWCRRIGTCAGLCCLVWSIDLHGSIEVYPFLFGNLVSTAATAFYFAVLSCWIWFHSLAVWKQLNNRAPPDWFYYTLAAFPIAFVVGGWAANIGLEIAHRQLWNYIYNLIFASCIIAYLILVTHTYLSLRSRLHTFMEKVEHDATAQTGVVPNSHSLVPAPGSGEHPSAHLLYALRILRVFMFIFVPCATVVLVIIILLLTDGFTNHLNDARPEPPGSIADAVPLLVLDSIGWALVCLMLWYSFPVLHTHAAVAAVDSHHPLTRAGSSPPSQHHTIAVHVKPQAATNGHALSPPPLGGRAVSDLTGSIVVVSAAPAIALVPTAAVVTANAPLVIAGATSTPAPVSFSRHT